MGRAPITVNVIADSITEGGCRLLTMEWTYPRMIHSEVMTHAMLRRNSASSRAIPAVTLRRRVQDSPAYPGSWGQNQRGMQADREVDDLAAAEAWWLEGRDIMAAHHAKGEALGLHKQVVNRVIEPWMMITVVVSATDWANFFHLRNHKDAEPSFQALAKQTWELFHESMPVYMMPGDWHLPFVRPDDHVDVYTMAMNVDDPRLGKPIDILKKVATGRCARVSFLTHHGIRDLREDVALHDKLIAAASEGGPLHLSPFEHVCQAVSGRQRIGPFTGWKQYRKFFPDEAGPSTEDRCFRCGCWGGRHVKACPNQL